MGTDPYGDVENRTFLDGASSKIDAPNLDLKEFYLASNATMFFVKIIVWGEMDGSSVEYTCEFAVINLTGLVEYDKPTSFSVTGIASYSSGTATFSVSAFDDRRIDAITLSNTLFMKIPINYLMEARCINDSKIVLRAVSAEKMKTDWRGIPEYSHRDYAGCNVQRYYYIEDVNVKPEANIVAITPNPAAYGDITFFYGDGYDPNNDTIDLKWKILDSLFVLYPDPNSSSIMAYEWYSSLDGFLSGSPSFNTSNLSVGKHTIYVRVKDGGGKWSENATAVLIVREKVVDSKIDYGWQKYLPHIIMLVTIGSVIGCYLYFYLRKRK
jgi:hypothetical protein